MARKYFQGILSSVLKITFLANYRSSYDTGARSSPGLVAAMEFVGAEGAPCLSVPLKWDGDAMGGNAASDQIMSANRDLSIGHGSWPSLGPVIHATW